MRSNNYSEGFSARGGQCRSAYNLTVNPGGSSSGSAVGVAANLFPFALGTETDGSIINPAERNAIVGLKPTLGLTSRAGVVPKSLNQDTVGVLAKSVRDAVHVLDAIYGPDERDSETLAQINHTPTGGFTKFLANSKALRNASFSIPWESFWRFASAEQLNTLAAMLNPIEEAGATIVNTTDLLDHETTVSQNGWNWDYGSTRGFPNGSEYTYIKSDFYRNIISYLAELNDTGVRSLEDIIAHNYANDGTEGGYPWPLGTSAFYSGQDGLLASLETKGVQDETYWQASNFCRASTRERGIDYALAQGPNGTKLDALLVPPDVGQSYQIAAQAGYPVITIPAGVNAESGMPYGFALMQSA
ncbi:glutamyl-tRNA(Gln) amidotransferase subunit A like protein [Zymoseptoria brevis]|uniref:Glutamyl-tRNA(Gln) amidotransferase subunit A like protein n=1 Tax=Zymoseptoria brevis TaxID=1047168 RepID=A0A0F4GRN5_9PEZI|nr:glutamyl-tRNA(Gln) amidotransferase subunit A like protein [Zymoseptoria brevis]